MIRASIEYLGERLGLADQLRLGRATMLEPQDLPGRYGRVIKAIDHVLELASPASRCWQEAGQSGVTDMWAESRRM